MNAELLMAICGGLVFVFTTYWVSRRQLRVKYALIWMFLACVILILGAFPKILMGLAAWARLSFPAAVLFIALGLIYLFCFSVSISLSRLHQRNLRLTQELALLEERLAEVEGR